MNRGTKGSGEGQKAAMTEEFQQIVRGADEFPFPLDAGEATKTETAQAARFLDTSKNRLDGRLS